MVEYLFSNFTAQQIGGSAASVNSAFTYSQARQPPPLTFFNQLSVTDAKRLRFSNRCWFRLHGTKVNTKGCYNQYGTRRSTSWEKQHGFASSGIPFPRRMPFSSICLRWRWLRTMVFSSSLLSISTFSHPFKVRPLKGMALPPSCYATA